MRLNELELDVNALQQLPETDPVEQDGIQLGDCFVTSCNVVATRCNVIATK